jgi:molybdate transport system substrate-binding protein
VNLLGNSIVLIAPKDSKVDNVTIGHGFDLAKLAGDGKIATGDVKSVPVGKYAKAALEKLGSWQAAEAEIRDGRQCARGADIGGSQRGRARHRLFDRRQGRARRQGRRHLPGRLASGDHLSRSRRRRRRKPETQDYLAFLRSSAAKNILEKYGFKFLVSPTT